MLLIDGFFFVFIFYVVENYLVDYQPLLGSPVDFYYPNRSNFDQDMSDSTPTGH